MWGCLQIPKALLKPAWPLYGSHIATLIKRLASSHACEEIKSIRQDMCSYFRTTIAECLQALYCLLLCRKCFTSIGLGLLLTSELLTSQPGLSMSQPN